MRIAASYATGMCQAHITSASTTSAEPTHSTKRRSCARARRRAKAIAAAPRAVGKRVEQCRQRHPEREQRSGDAQQQDVLHHVRRERGVGRPGRAATPVRSRPRPARRRRARWARLRPSVRCASRFHRSRPSAYAVPAATTTSSASGLATTGPAAARMSATGNEHRVRTLQEDEGQTDRADEQAHLREEQQLTGVVVRGRGRCPTRRREAGRRAPSPRPSPPHTPRSRRGASSRNAECR